MFAAEETLPRYTNEANKLISSILVPTNFSKRSTDAATFALGLAQHFDATVTLLHVERPVEGDSFWTREAARWAKEQMAKFLPAARGDSRVRRIVGLHTDINEEIHHIAAETGADLIVMPMHGYGVIHRALLGSVAAGVLRGATRPVWSTSHAALASPAAWLHPQRILCAVDSQTVGSNVVAWASQFSSELDGKLYLAWNWEGLADAHEQINRLERKYHIYAEELIGIGSAPEALQRTASRMEADLVVIGRNFGRSSDQPRMDMYQVVRNLPCPVVSL